MSLLQNKSQYLISYIFFGLLRDFANFLGKENYKIEIYQKYVENIYLKIVTINTRALN